jgi:hypothetical protein
MIITQADMCCPVWLAAGIFSDIKRCLHAGLTLKDAPDEQACQQQFESMGTEHS